jgi:hypothetical protein
MANKTVTESAGTGAYDNFNALYQDLGDGTNYAEVVAAPLITADADMTQLVTVTTAGTPVQGPDKSNAGGWAVKADPANTGYIYFMFHGQSAATKGFPLSAGQTFILPVLNLSAVDFDASVNGEKVWLAKL